MIRLVIDGRPVETPEGTTVLKAAEEAGIAIPHFCYHEAFPPEGSCRVCLVEIEGMPKLDLACSAVVREGMKVRTTGERVIQARRAVLEFLLTEHPLDCPICDKSGECKLQDYCLDAGLTVNAFSEIREKREKKIPIGEKLLLDRERCILCSRCVRFLRQVTGTRELGLFDRGVGTVIDLYEGEPVRNNYAGNLVDVCPVGAITDTEFRFKTRPWFLEARPAVCPLCSRGCSIWADYHPGFPRVAGSAKIYRFRPRLNPEVNGHWICDVGRYGALALERDRLAELRWIKGPSQARLSWATAIDGLAAQLRGLKISGAVDRAAIVLSSRLTSEELFLAKKIFHEELGVGAGRLVFADPADGEADTLLLRADRTPNRQAAMRLGFSYQSDPGVALKGASFAWIFGADREALEPSNLLAAALQDVPIKVLSAPQETGLEPLMDFVLPTASVFEKSGSFANGDGWDQEFRPVHRPCGNARSEESILVDLGRALGLDPEFYASLDGPRAVARALRSADSRFGGEG
ncbi:MAG: 2Fe-2S iron-sulfur cluster-binding protein [Candidatus Aminicenantales bacterium]|jgi:NADH-quinone oxidoreductase subunit G